MSKLELLKKLHELAWNEKDTDTLYKVQSLIDREIVHEASKGNLSITQNSNGFITT